jgi:hypothetical protein
MAAACLVFAIVLFTWFRVPAWGVCAITLLIITGVATWWQP